MKQVKHTFYENTASVTAGTTNPTKFMNLPAQGIQAFDNFDNESSQGQRIGNTIFVKGIQMNFQVTLGESVLLGDDKENLVRMVIFQWLEEDLTAPVFGDIFLEGTTGQPYLANYNPDTRSLYKILYDKTFTLSPNGGNPVTIARHIELSRKLKMKKWVFEGNNQSGFGANLVKGNIYWIFTSDSTAAPSPTVDWSLRFRYTD